jgi:hypothetical protein
MAALDSNVSYDVETDTDSGDRAYIRVTDLEDGTARVQLDQRLSWLAVLELLQALPPDDTMPS